MLILDTHVLVWLDQGANQLGDRARRMIEDAFHNEELSISTVSFWEIGMLVNSNRLEFDGSLAEWRVALLNSGIQEVPANGGIALSASELSSFDGDPVDRLITATAIQSDARLVTADDRLLRFRNLKTVNGLN